MSSGISSNINLLAGDTCIFLFGHDTPKSVNGMTKDLATVSKSTIQWKIIFYTDPAKQTQDITSSRKTTKTYHSSLLSITLRFHKFFSIQLDTFHLQ